MNSQTKRRKLPGFFIPLLIVGILAVLLIIHDPSVLKNEYIGKFTVHFLDVGQGDATLFLFPNGESVLIDTGTNDAEGYLLSYLRSCHIKTIDYLILTHPHEDHIGGADAILDTFRVKHILLLSAEGEYSTYERMVRAIENEHAEVSYIHADDRFSLADSEFLFLTPRDDPCLSLNDQSAVTHVTYGSTSFLLMADAEEDAEAELLSAYSPEVLHADILRIGHHGSLTSTTEAFLDAVSPGYAVISCGLYNDYGHPRKEVLERLAGRNIPYFRTDLNGTVVYFDENHSFEAEKRPAE